MKILHLSCSPRGQASESHRLARRILDCLFELDPAATLVTRVVGDGSIPHVDGIYADTQGGFHQPSDEQRRQGSTALSEALIQELESADVVVIGTPMHNYTVPSGLKAWIDHIVCVDRTFKLSPNGKIGTLRDRPILVAAASGGRFSGERVRQPDFLTPYLRAILGMIGLHDLTFFTVEGTGYGAEAVAETRTRTDQMLRDYFSSLDDGTALGAFRATRSPAPLPNQAA